MTSLKRLGFSSGFKIGRRTTRSAIFFCCSHPTMGFFLDSSNTSTSTWSRDKRPRQRQQWPPKDKTNVEMVPDPYKILNLPHSADAEQIKRSYRQLARKYHPDTWSQPCFSESEKQQATAKFAEIAAAYALLSDEKAKSDYDKIYKYGGYDDEETAGPPSSRSQYAAPPPRPAPPPPTSSAPPPPPKAPWRGRTVQYPPAVHSTTNNDATSDHYYRPMQEEHPSHAARRPDNHQCDAFCSLCLCPPIGIIAMYHSISVDRCWKQGLYGDSVNHARQAPKYACLGNVIGIGFWIYWLLFREGSDFEWPDFDFDWGDP